MQPILGSDCTRQHVKAIGLLPAVFLACLLGASPVLADTTNFLGDFGEAFWSKQPQFGTVGFSNSDTEVVLAGPKAPATETLSFEGVTYNGPLAGGLAVGGTVQFAWSYTSGDALSSSEADFAWTPPGGGDPVPILLAQGGPGVATNGVVTTSVLAAGTTLQFLLGTDTLANKLSGTLVISDFQFHPDIPEPSTGALFAGALMAFGVARLRHQSGLAGDRNVRARKV